jgi:aspartate carbamoyltransferase catalytic subunit
MKRDIITISDLSNAEIEEIFDLADSYLDRMAVGERGHQIRGRRSDAQGHLMTSLFYEPSTRTRFSFEAAMVRLGGSVLGTVDPVTSSAAKGESLADTVRVMENYADLIVMRHPSEGAARAAAEYVDIPVINGGDGGHEHPTQTLCDLYTLRRENESLRDLNVLLVGDLKNGRTVHSLVYALARFAANIIPMPAKGFELPEQVTRRLQEEYHCRPYPKEMVFGSVKDTPQIDVVYVAPGSSLNMSVVPPSQVSDTDEGREVARPGKRPLKFDVCYVTRLQGERLAPGHVLDADYPVIDAKFLQGKRFTDTRVLHPLPRVSELGYDLDKDPRGIYFKQAAYGVPVRMALIAKVLGIEPFSALDRVPARKVYAQGVGMQCSNPRCITHHPSESRHLMAKFWLVRSARMLARCCYCETDSVVECFVNVATRQISTSFDGIDELASSDVVLFASEADAHKAGFTTAQRRRGEGG